MSMLAIYVLDTKHKAKNGHPKYAKKNTWSSTTALTDYSHSRLQFRRSLFEFFSKFLLSSEGGGLFLQEVSCWCSLPGFAGAALMGVGRSEPCRQFV